MEEQSESARGHSLYMRISLLSITGVAVTLLGLVTGVTANLKLKPHALVSLDIPVWLSGDHVETGNFRVEPLHLYYVDIDLEKRRSHQHGCEPTTVLATRWVLKSATGHVDRGTSPWEDSGLTLAVFLPSERDYSFQAQVSPGAGCLDLENPRLKVRTHPSAGDAYTALTWTSVLTTIVGIVVFSQPLIWPRSEHDSMITVLGDSDH
jgi:hypothetical protein